MPCDRSKPFSPVTVKNHVVSMTSPQSNCVCYANTSHSWISGVAVVFLACVEVRASLVRSVNLNYCECVRTGAVPSLIDPLLTRRVDGVPLGGAPYLT
jgi:pantothenate kinase type III